MEDCDCPVIAGYEEMGTKSHTNDCPLVENIFKHAADTVKEERQRHGGMLYSPGELEARRLRGELAELRAEFEAFKEETRRD